jgi:hypothetical protein
MKFEVTTKADQEMGNATITITAGTPRAAANQYDVRACDYFCEQAESHVGEAETIVVEDMTGEITCFETTYK